MMHNSNSKGFIAVTAVVVIVSGILVYSVASMASVFAYSDVVLRREWRIQANFNAQACLETVALMSARDYFLEGDIKLEEFGCFAHVERDHASNTVDVRAQSIFSGISSSDFEQNFSIP
ncbi:MAG TPA: hypothetical protein VL335_03855 [Candidatus Paceibacterota bacterium]|jgi:hypothetical protein|nr:hypothetical protein [Candidatus Paceibacterota bacterium]